MKNLSLNFFSGCILGCLLFLGGTVSAQVTCNETTPSPAILNTGSDSDHDGIPDLLDWDKNNDGSSEFDNIPKDVVQLQLSTWKDFGILFMNCGEARYDARVMQAFIWIFKTVFTTAIRQGKFSDYLLFIASTDTKGASAYTQKQKIIHTTGLLRFNRDGSKSDPVPTFGNIVHELAHAYHASVVAEENPVNDLVFKELFGTGGSISSRRSPEWNMLGQGEIAELIRSYQSGRISAEEFLKTIPSLEPKACISKGTMVCSCRAPVMRKSFIVSNYGTKSPKEYYAESLVAAFFKAASRGLNPHQRDLFEFEVGRRYLGHQFMNLHPSLEAHFDQQLNLKDHVSPDATATILNY